MFSCSRHFRLGPKITPNTKSSLANHHFFCSCMHVSMQINFSQLLDTKKHLHVRRHTCSSGNLGMKDSKEHFNSLGERLLPEL